MSFSRFALGFTRNRKVHKLSDAAFRLWVSAIDYAREQCTDGHITHGDLDTVPRCPPRGRKRDTIISEILTSGLWRIDGDGWCIHDFLIWQDSSTTVKQKRELARSRMQRVRANTERTEREHPLLNSTDRSREVRSGGRREEGREKREEDAEGAQQPPETNRQAIERIETAAQSEFRMRAADDRETICPLTLALPEPARLELAEKYRQSVEVIVEAEREFVSYWTIGGGQGKRRSSWLARLREDIRKKHMSGKLDEFAARLARPTERTDVIVWEAS